jgi:hypothetical protein
LPEHISRLFLENPKLQRLYGAVHRYLVVGLAHSDDGRLRHEAYCELIDAHDSIARDIEDAEGTEEP